MAEYIASDGDRFVRASDVRLYEDDPDTKTFIIPDNWVMMFVPEEFAGAVGRYVENLIQVQKEHL